MMTTTMAMMIVLIYLCNLRSHLIKGTLEWVPKNIEEFMETLAVDEDVAAVLVEEGFTTLDEIAYVLENSGAKALVFARVEHEARYRRPDGAIWRLNRWWEPSGHRVASR